MARLYHNLGYLLPAAGIDPEATYAVASNWRPGQIAHMQDDYGPRYFMMVQNRSTAAIVQGALVSSIGDTTGLTAYTATGGTTLTVVGGATLVANKHVGAILIVKDDAGAAGAAPEGSSRIVAANSTTTIQIQNDVPFTAAPAASDTVEIMNTWGIELAAAGDYASVVKGVVIPEAGIPDTYFGIAQIFGVCPGINVLANAVIAVKTMLIASTGVVTVTGAASPLRLHVGTSYGTVSTDQVAEKCVADLACGPYAKSYSDLDGLA